MKGKDKLLSSLKLWVRTLFMVRCTRYNYVIKICQTLAKGQWFSPGTLVSSTNKTDRHDITEIVLKVRLNTIIYLIWFIVFNTTFNNISAISWRPVLVVENPEYPERTTDHVQATGKLYHLRLRVECTPFCNLQSPTRTHAVLVISLYELLGNPTT